MPSTQETIQHRFGSQMVRTFFEISFLPCYSCFLIACKQALLGALGLGEKNSFSSDPPPPCCSVQQERGKEPGTIGAGGVWEAEAKKAGGGISKREGSGGNMGQLPNDAKYFAIEKGLK